MAHPAAVAVIARRDARRKLTQRRQGNCVDPLRRSGTQKTTRLAIKKR